MAVLVGAEIGIADIQAGHLTLVPPSDSAGPVPLGFQAHDDGGFDDLGSSMRVAQCAACDLDLSVNYINIVIPTASLGDRVWLDDNGNGVQDAGEAGKAGVTVNLLDVNGVVVATQAIDVNGQHLFTHPTPGTYSVQFDAPTGYLLTPRDARAAGGCDLQPALCCLRFCSRFCNLFCLHHCPQWACLHRPPRHAGAAQTPAGRRGCARCSRYLPSTPSFLLIRYCCAIDRMLFVSQYSTRPAGNTKNITENTSGMIHIIFA